VLDVRGNDAARQLVPRPESVFSQVRESQTPAFTPRLRSTITYSVTPPRQNSMESDRPTHVFTDTQSQRQHCARSSPLLPTLICLLRQPFSAPCLLPTMNVCRLLRDLTATTLLFASVCLETEILAVTCSGSHSSGLSGEGIRGCHLHLDECVQCLDDYL
jgi:hypothetical protein